jgi:hypothetical protein
MISNYCFAKKILCLLRDKKITDRGMEKLLQLNGLNLFQNSKITDNGIKSLSLLTDLNLSYCNNITDIHWPVA